MNFCNPAFVVAAPSALTGIMILQKPEALSAMCGLAQDSNALSIISCMSSNLSIFEKTLGALSLTLNFVSWSDSGISNMSCSFRLL